VNLTSASAHDGSASIRRVRDPGGVLGRTQAQPISYDLCIVAPNATRSGSGLSADAANRAPNGGPDCAEAGEYGWVKRTRAVGAWVILDPWKASGVWGLHMYFLTVEI
jgi:hypothetical protein